jgi:hypothetical protein
MHSSLLLEDVGGVRRSVATAFLCGFCGALAGAGLSLVSAGQVSWIGASLAGAVVMTIVGWRIQDRAE